MVATTLINTSKVVSFIDNIIIGTKQKRYRQIVKKSSKEISGE